jgi:hypothetical protein
MIKQKEFLKQDAYKTIEDKYNAKFVGVFCIKNGDNWRNAPSAIFYQETPPQPEYSNYFAVSYSEHQLVISDGKSFNSNPIFGVVANDGQVIYSAYRHDYVESDDGSVMIDGGRDYLRCTSDSKLVELIIDKDQIKIKDSLTLKDTDPNEDVLEQTPFHKPDFSHLLNNKK